MPDEKIGTNSDFEQLLTDLISSERSEEIEGLLRNSQAVDENAKKHSQIKLAHPWNLDSIKSPEERLEVETSHEKEKTSVDVSDPNHHPLSFGMTNQNIVNLLHILGLQLEPEGGTKSDLEATINFKKEFVGDYLLTKPPDQVKTEQPIQDQPETLDIIPAKTTLADLDLFPVVPLFEQEYADQNLKKEGYQAKFDFVQPNKRLKNRIDFQVSYDFVRANDKISETNNLVGNLAKTWIEQSTDLVIQSDLETDHSNRLITKTHGLNEFVEPNPSNVIDSPLLNREAPEFAVIDEDSQGENIGVNLLNQEVSDKTSKFDGDPMITEIKETSLSPEKEVMPSRKAQANNGTDLPPDKLKGRVGIRETKYDSNSDFSREPMAVEKNLSKIDGYGQLVQPQTIKNSQSITTSAVQQNDLTSNIIEQIVSRIGLRVDEHQQEINIQLKPDFLGKVNIKIAIERGIVNAEFIADSQMVKEIIAASLPQLRLDMQELGMNMGQIYVNLSNYDSQREPYQGHQQSPKRQVNKSLIQATEPVLNQNIPDAVTNINIRI